MQALQWAVDYPERVAFGHPDRDDLAPLAAADRVQTTSAGRDPGRPRFHEGDYYGWRTVPERGCPWRGWSGSSPTSRPKMHEKFGRMKQLAAAKGGRGRGSGPRDDRTALLESNSRGRVPEAPGGSFVFDRRFDRQLVPVHHEGDRHLRPLRVLGRLAKAFEKVKSKF